MLQAVPAIDRQPKRWLAYKAFDADYIREKLLEQGMEAVILPKAIRTEMLLTASHSCH